MEAVTTDPSFVIKPEELPALNFLASDHPRPCAVEWINRGTDRKLRQSSVDQLLRTLNCDVASPSVVRLHRTSGLRATFPSEPERDRFARNFSAARERALESNRYLVTAVFDLRDHAEAAIGDLKASGIAERAISVLWRVSQFIDPKVAWPDGHSKLSVASATAGGGIAGALFGAAVLLVPGFGLVAAAGTIAGTVLTSVAATSGVIGATGGAIARMLTDHDVDGVSATYYQRQISRGKVFVSVDLRNAESARRDVLRIVARNHGRTSVRS